MKPCYLEKSKMILVRVNRIVMPLALVLLGAALFVFLRDGGSFGDILLASVMFGLVLAFGILTEWAYTRAYEVNPEGIRVQNFGKAVRFYPWARVSKICLCRIHYIASREAWDEVIWCSLDSLPDGPPHTKRRWTREHYTLTHLSSALQIQLTPERLQEFRECSPHPIEDFRSKF